MDLVIVHDSLTSDIAQQINAKISTIEACQSRVLNENEWINNKAQISSEQHVLFIGKVQDGIALTPSIKWKYKESNMKYGWCGTKALMLVENCEFTKDEKKELEKLLENQTVIYSPNIKDYEKAFFMGGLIGIAIRGFIDRNDKLYKKEYEYMVNMLFGNRLVDFEEFIGSKEEVKTF